jgi:hypothetical protein
MPGSFREVPAMLKNMRYTNLMALAILVAGVAWFAVILWLLILYLT